MSVTKYNPKKVDEQLMMIESQEGCWVSRTDYDHLNSDFKKFVERFHRRTKLGRNLTSIIYDDNCLLATHSLKKRANSALAEWAKEMKV
ncbi:MAG: hypothetical protein V1825_01780 [Candidatus Falkowbacteria bacterium]